VLQPLLTAHWRYLSIVTFRIEPDVLASYVPSGVELELENGQAYVSVCGFLCYHTVVVGMPLPRHRNFEEVDLRFYVRKKSGDTWRRGVVFIRELVPKTAVAITARVFDGEPYLALPMRSDVRDAGGEINVRYEWKRGSKWEGLGMTAKGEPERVLAGTHEEFILQRCWRYTTRNAKRTSEYRIEHPRWQIWRAQGFEFKAEVTTLYGDNFVAALSGEPVSAFIADGSFVTVYRREGQDD
jgi:uncharacterized protein YqjF (DUF2071 family)